ncbi:hypothetical protein KIW84_012164 [Lathyrus oleraceus]|uniref:DUF4283 domain-containing protein n=1 Tax=Pisum sativum TaxID=3888 RepID=A0A9D5BGT7_PEA|nr:hypothetical protein KIW84_012164 [Pisum sativum]
MMGKKFGFVRFFDVGDVDNLTVKLDNIFIDKQKLFVIVPRFQRELGHGEYRNSRSGDGEKSVQTREGVSRANKGFREGRTYADVAVPLKVQEKSQGLKQSFQMEFNMEEDEVWERFNKAYVGEELINNKAQWLQGWFKVVKKWNPEVVDQERVTWIRVFGTCCHISDSGFFELIARPIGYFTRSDDDTRNQKKMDVARFLEDDGKDFDGFEASLQGDGIVGIEEGKLSQFRKSIPSFGKPMEKFTLTDVEVVESACQEVVSCPCLPFQKSVDDMLAGESGVVDDELAGHFVSSVCNVGPFGSKAHLEGFFYLDSRKGVVGLDENAKKNYRQLGLGFYDPKEVKKNVSSCGRGYQNNRRHPFPHTFLVLNLLTRRGHNSLWIW